MLVSASNALIFSSYAVWSMMTVAFPLSAGAMTMVSASLCALMAFCSSGERLVGSGFNFARQPANLVLVSCASDGHTLLRPSSTAAIISGIRILLGAEAKYKPLANTPFSSTDRGLDDRSFTHLSLGHRGCEPPVDRFNKASNFLFCCSFCTSLFSPVGFWSVSPPSVLHVGPANGTQVVAVGRTGHTRAPAHCRHSAICRPSGSVCQFVLQSPYPPGCAPIAAPSDCGAQVHST